MIIGICDGNANHRRELQRLLSLVLFDITEYEFYHYSDGYEVINAVENGKFKAELLFIDIALPKLNGLKTVHALRKMQVKVDIIFITELDKYVFEGYIYHAYDFLIKPASPKIIGTVMQRYVEEKISGQPDNLQITVNNNSMNLNLKSVLFFEGRKRKVAAVTGVNEIEFYHKMDELEEKTLSAGFVRCHQSYIVNKNAIVSCSNTSISLINGGEIPISRTYAGGIKNLFNIGV